MASGIFQTKPRANEVRSILEKNSDELKTLLRRYTSQFTMKYFDDEDAYSDVYATLWRHADKYNGSTMLSTWVLTVAKRHLFQKIKRMGRTHSIDITSKEFTHPSEESRDYLYAIRELVEKEKDEKTRSALKMRYWDDMTFKDIGIKLGISTSLVEVLIKNWLSKQRERISL